MNPHSNFTDSVFLYPLIQLSPHCIFFHLPSFLKSEHYGSMEGETVFHRGPSRPSAHQRKNHERHR
jgi:hypothetical protein